MLESDARSVTSSLSFRHLPPNSAPERALQTPSTGLRRPSPTIAVTGYAIGLEKLSANGHCSNSSKFVTDNSVDDDELMLNVLRCHLTY